MVGVMKVLVTGGAGFIGSHVVDALLERGYDVRIFDSLELPTHATGRPAYLSPDAEFVLGDMRDLDAVRRALQGVRFVVHLAATGGFTPRIANYVQVNSLGTAQMLEMIQDERLPIDKIVVASSVAVYGEGRYQCATHGALSPPLRSSARMAKQQWEHECPFCGGPLTPGLTDEWTAVEPATPYAVSKYDEERLTLAFGRHTGIPAVALRFFVTYGPRQSFYNPHTGVCSIFASRILNDRPVTLYEDGQQTRDFVFVEDVARANVFVLEEPRADFGVFNVGTGRPTTIAQLARLVERCLGRPAVIAGSDRFRPGDVRHLVADPSSLARLGFRAERLLADGLREYVEWLLQQGPIPESFGAAERELLSAGVVREAKRRE
jgi:dTDP-L-rhamnose 4-epimerase